MYTAIGMIRKTASDHLGRKIHMVYTHTNQIWPSIHSTESILAQPHGGHGLTRRRKDHYKITKKMFV